MHNQSWLTNETYSADRSTKVGILISVNTSLIIYKLVNAEYELFQTIDCKQNVPINLSVSTKGDIIELKLYSNTTTTDLKYQQRGSKYVKIN